jgi:hypothetical protein
VAPFVLIRPALMTPRHLAMWVGATLVLGAAGCGAPATCHAPAGADSGAPLSCVRTTPTAQPSGANGVTDGPSANGFMMSMLDTLIGRWLRGEAAVYIGTASVHDNQSILQESDLPSNGDLPPGGVIASLEPYASETDLTIFDTCAATHVALVQPGDTPTQTKVGPITPVNTSATATAVCSGCAPSFADRPATLTWTNAAAVDEQGLFRSTTSAELTRESPCDVTWSQLVVLDSLAQDFIGGTTGLSGFKRVGDEMILDVSGFTQPAPFSDNQPAAHSTVTRSRSS